MAVTTNTNSNNSPKRKAQAYAYISVKDKNGVERDVETNDIWLFATKASDNSINETNNGMLKAWQKRVDELKDFNAMNDKERGAIIAKGNEPLDYFEVPASLKIKIPKGLVSAQEPVDQTDVPF